MSETQYNLQLDKLCNNLELGKMISVPRAISGGLLHRMYAIETTHGKYAVKALNPKIMLRPKAMNNYINSERIANIAAANIPALPAKKFNGTCMQEIDNQYYLVFDWVDGKSLQTNEVKIAHCEKIGAILADIHMNDFSELGIINDWSDNEYIIDWDYYLKKGQENNADWVNTLIEVIDDLYYWSVQACKASKLLATDMVISHRDLDPKNVMWNQDNPIIIDWESASYINPMHELTETAVYWAESRTGELNKERFLAFLTGYKKRYGALEANWRIVLTNALAGKLAWLEYNFKRSLWIECTDEEEQQMGTTQIKVTINSIRDYVDMIPKLEKWISSETL